MTVTTPYATHRQQARRARLRAKDMLRLPGMRLHLILSTILCLCFWVGAVYIAECTFAAIPWEALRVQSPLLYQLLDTSFYVVDGVIIVLIGLPLLFGTAMIYQAALRGQKVAHSTLFCAFASPAAYRRALGIMLSLLLPLVLAAAIIFHLFSLATAADQLVFKVLFAALASGWLVAACVLIGYQDAVLPLAYLRPNARLRELFCASCRTVRGRLFPLWLFKLTYLGWWLLSLLSLGILLIYHALPSFLLAHAAWLDNPDDSNTSI